MDEPGVFRIEPGEELDLHHFSPRDAKSLVVDFIDDARAKGLARVRIVHGRGRSVLKSITLSALAAHPAVESFHDDKANWGATIVHITIDK
jgi:DNA-nicking Smr family endonuclease